jgi:hypothetical protein
MFLLRAPGIFYLLPMLTGHVRTFTAMPRGFGSDTIPDGANISADIGNPKSPALLLIAPFTACTVFLAFSAIHTAYAKHMLSSFAFSFCWLT